jgi:ATP-binding cassette subfamily F protein uup
VEAREVSKPRAAKSSAPKERARADARRLTFKDKHALETLPARMATLEKDIAALHLKLADSKLYARDPKGFADMSAKLEAAATELASSEERWLELEMLREDLERQ